MRVLIAEDERDMNRILCKKLAIQGYAVDACFDGSSALEYLDATPYDVVILDIMMPKLDGLEVLTRMRKAGNTTPVLLLTAKDEISSRVQGLDLGANDYLIKPFALDELMARVRVLIREPVKKPTSVFTAQDLTVDVDQHQATRAGKTITLSSKEFAVLEYLIRNKNSVLSRQRIQEHVWSYDYEGSSNIVDVYIRYLRKKIDEGYSNKLIHTIRGSGYLLKDTP